jgi:hypothetical protein
MIQQARRVVVMVSALALLVTPAVVRSAESDGDCSRGFTSTTLATGVQACKIHVPAGRCEAKLSGGNVDGATFNVVFQQSAHVVDGSQLPISTCLVCELHGSNLNSADLRPERIDIGTRREGAAASIAARFLSACERPTPSPEPSP